MCKKLDTFKQSWNFKYVMIATPILLLTNLYLIYKMLFNQQMGGSKVRLYYTILLMLLAGYGVSFLNDYAIVDLFSIMKTQECPCARQDREFLENITYGKIAINGFFLLAILKQYDMKMLNKVLRQLKKQK